MIKFDDTAQVYEVWTADHEWIGAYVKLVLMKDKDLPFG